MIRLLTGLSIFLIALFTFAPNALAHCQVPCGIFDDKARISAIQEDITTVEKAIHEINTLSAAQPVNYNQIVRWVNTKEAHAEKIMDTVADYWMAQRVKLADPKDAAATDKYFTQLTTLHHIQVFAMKAKQSTDPANIKKLRDLVDAFSHQYYGPSQSEEKSAAKSAPCPHGKACPHGTTCPEGQKCPHAECPKSGLKF